MAGPARNRALRARFGIESLVLQQEQLDELLASREKLMALPELNILYEDNHCLAVDKSAGCLSTHYQGKEETIMEIIQSLQELAVIVCKALFDVLKLLLSALQFLVVNDGRERTLTS